MRKPLPRGTARTADNGKVRLGAGFGLKEFNKQNFDPATGRNHEPARKSTGIIRKD